jgi:hypothetical protein
VRKRLLDLGCDISNAVRSITGSSHGLKYSPRALLVRSTFGSSRNPDEAAFTFRARTGLMHRSKQHLYSIISAASIEFASSRHLSWNFRRKPHHCL